MKTENKMELLAGKGCKNTKSRKAVIEVLENTGLPITADEIHKRVVEMGFSTNLSTVYRTLELLENKGMLEKSIMMDSKACYRLLCEEHRHLIVCTGCHAMVEISGCPLEILEKNVCEATKFDITGHKLELYGLCPQCKKG